jgi:hypothetical protein
VTSSGGQAGITLGMSRITFHRFVRLLLVVIVAAWVLACRAQPARAGSVQFQLGEQDFADGKTPVYSDEIRAAGAGEMFPFDGTIFGNDMKSAGGLGAFDYTHTFDLAGATPVAAKLTLGLIDIDSPPEHPLDTLAVLFNGVSQPVDFLRGVSVTGARSSVEVVDIPVPLDLLAGGTLHVSVVATKPGYGNLGNAIEPDFSRLMVETASGSVTPPNNNGGGGDPDPIPVPPPIIDPGPGPHAVPLPPMLIPAGMMLAGLAAMPKGRLRRWLRM